MSLVVEDGSGLANAESYISVADATTRHANLGNVTWAALASDTIREQCLRRATVFMEQAYRERWIGRRNHYGQMLSWPRWGVMVDGLPVYATQVPPEVANACADLALKASLADLNADLKQVVVMKKVGPIETQYDRYSPQRARYPSIEMMLAPFLNGSGASVSLLRA